MRRGGGRSPTKPAAGLHVHARLPAHPESASAQDDHAGQHAAHGAHDGPRVGAAVVTGGRGVGGGGSVGGRGRHRGGAQPGLDGAGHHGDACGAEQGVDCVGLQGRHRGIRVLGLHAGDDVHLVLQAAAAGRRVCYISVRYGLGGRAGQLKVLAAAHAPAHMHHQQRGALAHAPRGLLPSQSRTHLEQAAAGDRRHRHDVASGGGVAGEAQQLGAEVGGLGGLEVRRAGAAHIHLHAQRLGGGGSGGGARGAAGGGGGGGGRGGGGRRGGAEVVLDVEVVVLLDRAAAGSGVAAVPCGVDLLVLALALAHGAVKGALQRHGLKKEGAGERQRAWILCLRLHCRRLGHALAQVGPSPAPGRLLQDRDSRRRSPHWA